MATEKLDQAVARMHEGCQRLVDRFMEFTEEDLARETPEEMHRGREWAQSSGGILAFVAVHNRMHVKQVLSKRKALSLQRTSAQKILADVIASQAELDAALLGLADGDLVSVPEGETWDIDKVIDHTIQVYDAFLSRIEEALRD